MIIGLSGPSGAGKDTVAKIIGEMFPAALFLRFSDAISESLKALGLPVSKENQQWLATLGRERFGTDFLANALLEKIKATNNSMIVVNGVRYPDEADGLIKHGAQIWFVEAPDRLRWTRMQTRGEKTDDECSWEDFMKKEEAATEQKIPAVKEMADQIIDNSGSLEELKQKICSLF